MDDLPHSYAQDEFCLWSYSENDGNDKKARHERNDLFHDDDDGIDRDNGMLKSYESGNVDFGPMLSSDNEYSFSTMSHVLGVKY